jgi:hypothetical protein
MDPFHERLARTGLAAAQRYGFALAGGYAVQAAGLVMRPSEDIDLFTAWERRAEFDAAVSAIVDAYLADGLSVDTERHHDAFVRLTVSDGERTSKVELAVDSRANEPILMTLGPVLRGDAVMAGWPPAPRAFARLHRHRRGDQSGRYDRGRCCASPNAPSSASTGVFAGALGQAQVLDADDFADYGVTGRTSTSCATGSTPGAGTSAKLAPTTRAVVTAGRPR